MTDARRKGELYAYTFPSGTIPGNYMSLTFAAENASEIPATLAEETIVLSNSEGNEFQHEANRNNGYVELSAVAKEKLSRGRKHEQELKRKLLDAYARRCEKRRKIKSRDQK